MKTREERIKRLLQTAYLEKITPEVADNRWRSDVMRKIRNLEPLNAKTTGWIVADQYIWKFATAASMVLLFLSIYTFQLNGQPEQFLANQFFNDPVGFSLLESFGIL